MALIAKRSRVLVFGVAFVGVMAGSGGLLGAIGGMILALLSSAVLGLSASTIEFIPASTGVGGLAATLIGIGLMARDVPLVSWQVRFAGAPVEAEAQ